MTLSSYALASFGTPVGNAGFFSGLISRLGAYRARAAERARLRHELESYTDRQLRDLGLTRLDIESVVSGQYAR